MISDEWKHGLEITQLIVLELPPMHFAFEMHIIRHYLLFLVTAFKLTSKKKKLTYNHDEFKVGIHNEYM